MKVKQEKIFIIKGADIKKTYLNEEKFHLFNEKALNNHAQVIEIGDGEEGFDNTKLSDYFEGKLDVNDKHANIILNAHGSYSEYDNTYSISTNKIMPNITLATGATITGTHFLEPIINDVLAQEILTELAKATNNRPLKILITACEGEYFQDYIQLLPKGSLMITLADKGKSFSSISEYNIDTASILNMLSKNEPLKIEELGALYCINQKLNSSKFTTPIIGVHDKSGNNHIFKVSEYVKSYVDKNKEYSSFFKVLFDNNIISEKHFDSLKEKIKNGANIEDFELPRMISVNIRDHIENQTINEFRQDIEEKYFMPGNLQGLKFAGLKNSIKSKNDFKEGKFRNVMIENNRSISENEANSEIFSESMNLSFCFIGNFFNAILDDVKMGIFDWEIDSEGDHLLSVDHKLNYSLLQSLGYEFAMEQAHKLIDMSGEYIPINDNIL